MLRTLTALLASSCASAFMLPGVVPKNYEKGQLLPITVGQLTSLQSAFTFDFYMLNFCSSPHGLGYDESKYGKTQTGAPEHESPYEYRFAIDQSVQTCTKTLTQGQIEQFSQMIQHNYKYKLYLDGLPSATILRDKKNKELPVDYTSGIPIGEYHGLGQIMIYNHLDIVVKVHTTLEGHHRIVGFEVEPYSMGEGPNRISNNPTSADEDQYLRAGEPFQFTYRTIMRVSY